MRRVVGALAASVLMATPAMACVAEAVIFGLRDAEEAASGRIAMITTHDTIAQCNAAATRRFSSSFGTTFDKRIEAVTVQCVVPQNCKQQGNGQLFNRTNVLKESKAQ